jgi:hypothetical protein
VVIEGIAVSRKVRVVIIKVGVVRINVKNYILKLGLGRRN